MASGRGPGSSPPPCMSTDFVDLSFKGTAAGDPAAPSVMLCKGFDTMLRFDPVPPIPGTSPPTEVRIPGREPESQDYLRLLHSRVLREAQSQYAAGTCITHQLAPCQVSQQKKPWVTGDQIMTHLRVNPTMPMNQSRMLLGIGHRRYKRAKEKVSSTDNDIIRFHKSNPNATHRSIKKTLCVGIDCFCKVTASASVLGSPSTPRSWPKQQRTLGHSVPHSSNPSGTFTPLQHQQLQYFILPNRR